MAKHVISEAYTFTPGTNTLVVNGKWIRREQLILILNVTSNTVIYNFSSSSLTASSYTNAITNGTEVTTIQLAYNCTGMSSTDKISFIVDETYETFVPAEAYRDPVEKFRTSQPQSLIDTDFEYGVQSTKWETIALTNNRPSAFYDPTMGISSIATTVTLPNQNSGSYQITAVAGNGTNLVTISINNTTGITGVGTAAVGTPIYVQDTISQNANGWFLAYTVTSNTSITYYARGTVINGSIFDSTKTYLFVGTFYTQAALPAGTTAVVGNNTAIVTITTTNNHGLTAGQGVILTGLTGGTANPPNGAFWVRTTPTSNTFTIDTTNLLPGSPNGTFTSISNASIYPRPWGTSIHRAYDGGVTFTAGYPYHGNQLIRQTRRYFRYQSGKGIQFSTGSNLCSPFQVDSLTASSTTVTVTTKFIHNINIGAIIKVAGADQAAYNGTFTVTAIPTDTTFTYTANSAPSPTTATSATGYTVQPYQWYGASLRIGMFDSQNGFYFEYDGQTIYAVRRSATTQLPGYISVLANGGQAVTGINTKFSETLIPGSFVAIRGMTYEVVSIESNTSMTIYPDYRGTSIASPSQVIINKIVETRIPQSQWNIDKMDGTGASGFTLDVTKMQMWYMDYAWYGAGAIRFGMKNNRGEVLYCHRLINNNVNTEAYMRSGNLPARYEVNTFYPKTIASASIGISDTTINVVDSTGFASVGNAIITASGNTGAAIEYIAYTGKTATSLTGVTRGITNLSGPGGFTNMGGGAASAFTYSATAPISVAYWGPQCATTISHWGSAVIMDGRYDDDKSIQFNYGLNGLYTYGTVGTSYPVFSIRLGPSVDSGLTGVLGAREIINRMQLQPTSMGVYPATGGVKVEVWLNARITGSANNWAPVGGSSLAQVALHGAAGSTTATIAGGERIYTYFAPAGGVSTQDLTKIRDIGNSILGGGTALTPSNTDANKYPDGPDVITIVVIPLAAATVAVRLNWTEAQA